MSTAFLLFLSCTIGRVQTHASAGVQLREVAYIGSQIGVEKNFKLHINRVLRQEGQYGESPITLELIKVKESWQTPSLWALEVEAAVVYQDRKSPIIRYRSLERIQYVDRFVEQRQEAYQKMYHAITQRVYHWMFMQRNES